MMKIALLVLLAGTAAWARPTEEEGALAKAIEGYLSVCDDPVAAMPRAPLDAGVLLSSLRLLACGETLPRLGFAAWLPDPDEPGEEPAGENVLALDDVNVIGSRTERKMFETPAAVSVVDQRELRRKQVMSAVDALGDRIGVWVEKRTSEASDPIMRGFSGHYIHAFVDGNSLSTLAGEGGPAGSSMYGRIDADSLARIEVVRGPSSVLYGTNAIGGVINFITRAPMDFTEEGSAWNVRAKAVYGSSAQQKRARVEFTGATPRWRYLIAGTAADIGDITGGRGQGVLVPSSAKPWSWDAKVGFSVAENQTLSFALYDTHVSDHHRYYVPLEESDLDRDAMVVTYEAFGLTPFWDRVEAKVYVQNKETESRNASNVVGDVRTSDVETVAVDFRADSPVGERHSLIYGLHWSRDQLESRRLRASTGLWERSAPDATWDDIGAYVQDEWRATDRLTLISAVRFDHYRYETDVTVDFPIPAGFSASDFEVDSRETTFTGGLEALFRLKDHLNLTGRVSRGFRQPQPSLSVRKYSTGVMIPSPDLGPEAAWTFEVGLRAQHKAFTGALQVYRTELRDFISLEPATYLGSDWFDWNGNGTRDPDEDVFRYGNFAEGYVHGIEIEGRWRPVETFDCKWLRNWEVFGGFNWMDGRNKTAGEHLGKLNPVRGVLGVRWQESPDKGWWCEFFADMVRRDGRIPASKLGRDPSYARDPQDLSAGLLRADGSIPGYTVFDLRWGYRGIFKRGDLVFAVENLTDKKYRVKESRMDSSGINFLASFIWNF